MIVSENNAGQYYPDYARNHPLFTKGMRVVSDSTVSRLLSEITDDQILTFLDGWNEGQDHRQRVYISYDSSNKNIQAGELELAEFGHAKDDKGVPIINISLVFDKNNRVPLFYEEYPGSINDVSQLQYLIDKVHSYRYRNIGFILDRGYFSRKNIEYMDAMNFSFLMMVKGCKQLVSQ
ncbi:transposase, partial [Desulfovibrio sp. An276]